MSDNTPYTLGLEFESVMGVREAVANRIKKSAILTAGMMAVTRDASVESPIAMLGRNSSLFLGNRLTRDLPSYPPTDMIAGYEAVTRPLTREAMRMVIDEMLCLQVSMGDVYSERSSIHTHVGFPRGFIFKKLAVAVGLSVEPLLYKLAGMGRVFRGYSNHSAYCRPLALPPAVCLSDLSDKIAILNPRMAVLANSEEMFWNCFGHSLRNSVDRYVPLRYFGLNLYSSLMRGTLEFRFWNFSTVSKYVQAITSLSQHIADLIIRIPLDTAINFGTLSIFNKNSNQDYKDLLDEVIKLGREYGVLSNISLTDYDSLLELIDITPQPEFIDVPIMSHINRSAFASQLARDAGLAILDSEDAIPPGIVDIHTFSNSDRSIIGV